MNHDTNTRSAGLVELSEAQTAQVVGGGFDAGSAAPPAKGLKVDRTNGDGKADLVVDSTPKPRGRP